MLYGDWIGRWGDSYPEAEALVDISAGRRYSYGDLRNEVLKMVSFLSREPGIGKGDRVAVLAASRAEYIILFFAVSRLGAILVPLNNRLTHGELIYYLKDSTPAVLFFDEKHRVAASFLEETCKLPHSVSFDRRPWEDGEIAAAPEVDITETDPQLVIYTSGTTGSPKGVIMTHRMITWNSINTNLGWGLGRGERTILHSALFYTGGWNVFTLPLFYSLGTNILIERFNPDLVIELIGSERITVFFAVPTMLQMMIDSPGFETCDFSGVRLMISGGAPLSRHIFDVFRMKGVHLRQGYGLTEAGPNNFMADGKFGTVGHPMPHVDICLVDSNGQRVRTGSEGELLLRGDHVSPGYWNKPYTGDELENGWLHTGDLARIDEDGHVSIVGRRKDMFISGGINIYPAEIEPFIIDHPAVASAAVIAVPDDKWGEVGKAVIELNPGCDVTLAELRAFLSERIAGYKIPKYMTTVDALPRTAASAKIQKFVLRERHGRADND